MANYVGVNVGIPLESNQLFGTSGDIVLMKTRLDEMRSALLGDLSLNAIEITGGTVAGVAITGSAISGAAGSFTTLAASGATTFNGTVLVNTDLTVNNLKLDGNTLSSTTGNILITPVSGSAIVLDSIWSIDSNTIQGLTAVDLTITATVGQKIIIEGIGIDSTVITGLSDANLTITPYAGKSLILDTHFGFDGTVLTALTDANTTITAYTGKNITIEGVTFDNGVVAGITSIDGHFGFSGTTITGLTDANTTITAYTGKNISIEGTTFDGGEVVISGLLTADNLSINLSEIYESQTNALANLSINYNGYAYGTTQFRDTVIGNGKRSKVLEVTGTDSHVALYGGLSTVGGIDAGDTGVYLKTKIIEIGDWDMNGTASVTIAHGLGAEWKKIRSIKGVIRNDSDDLYINFESNSSYADGGIVSFDATNINCNRTKNGTDYNATSYNRGWLTVIYTT